jgi:hypothetical protein
MGLGRNVGEIAVHRDIRRPFEGPEPIEGKLGAHFDVQFKAFKGTLWLP